MAHTEGTPAFTNSAISTNTVIEHGFEPEASVLDKGHIKNTHYMTGITKI